MDYGIAGIGRFAAMTGEVDKQPVFLGQLAADFLKPTLNGCPCRRSLYTRHLMAAILVAKRVLFSGQPRKQLIYLGNLVGRICILQVSPRSISVGKEDVVRNGAGIVLCEELLEHENVLFQRNLIARGVVSAADRQEMI